MSDLYDDDVLLWSERQAALLRRIAAGEPVNERPDWPNIIEEVESVGRSDLRAVESLLLQALVHMLKAEVWPTSPAVPGWQAEVKTVPGAGTPGIRTIDASAPRCARALRGRAARGARDDGRAGSRPGLCDLRGDAGRAACRGLKSSRALTVSIAELERYTGQDGLHIPTI